MRKLLRNNEGASAIEFAIVILPVMFFMIGIVQTGYLVWANNLLHAAVDAAARCGAILGSTTSPCPPTRSGIAGDLTDMTSTANTVFAPLSGASFTGNTATATCNGSGLTGTYHVSIGFIINLTLTGNACYPIVVPPP